MGIKRLKILDLRLGLKNRLINRWSKGKYGHNSRTKGNIED